MRSQVLLARARAQRAEAETGVPVGSRDRGMLAPSTVMELGELMFVKVPDPSGLAARRI